MGPVALESCQVLTSSREMYLRMHLGFEPHLSGALKTTAPRSACRWECRGKGGPSTSNQHNSNIPFLSTPGVDGEALPQETSIFSHILSMWSTKWGLQGANCLLQWRLTRDHLPSFHQMTRSTLLATRASFPPLAAQELPKASKKTFPDKHLFFWFSQYQHLSTS